MTAPSRLDAARRAEALAGLPAWRHDAARDAISRSLRFADFNEAFAFMTRVALAAERLDHHPEWSNIYNRVEITWSTHDCGGLSERDVEMAQFVDRLHPAGAGY